MRTTSFLSTLLTSGLVFAGSVFGQQSANDMPLDNSARTVGVLDEGNDTSSCLQVRSYGGDPDLARHGKILSLAFRTSGDESGLLVVSGGEAGAAYGIMLGAHRAEIRLPWQDTILVAGIIAIGSGTFAADGTGSIPINLAGVMDVGVDPDGLEFYAQAIGMIGDRPVTSQGLELSLCGINDVVDNRGLDDTGLNRDLDDQTFTIGREAYSTYPLVAQILQSADTDLGYSVLASVTVPSSGFQFRSDFIQLSEQVTVVMLSVVPPADDATVQMIIEQKHLRVDIGTEVGRRIEVFVADRLAGIPYRYQLALSGPR